MNLFVQGMRRSGTTILYDAFLEDPGLRCFYEPFCYGKVTMGGGSGVREVDLFEDARALREDIRRRRYPSLDAEIFNWGGPRDPDRELETALPEHCRDYLGFLLDSAPQVLVKEVRMFRKIPELLALDPDAALVQVVRDPRAVAASHLLGRGAEHLGSFPTDDAFFEHRSGRGLWSSSRLSELLLEWPEYAHLGENLPDFLRVLLVWKMTFEETRREGRRCFGDHYMLLRHEEFRADPVGSLDSVYRLRGRPMPDEVASFARRHVQPKQRIFAEEDPRWLEAFERLGLEAALRDGGYSGLLAPAANGASGGVFRVRPMMSRREDSKTADRKVGGAPRVGIVAWWFNRGQAVVARQLRSALEALGHETFVLARPTRGKLDLASMTRSGDVWDQPGVTPASKFKVPLREYEEWVSENGIEVVFFDQNYQFEEISALRRKGIKTVGRFVWESFSAEHVGPALKAFDTIYSVTRCEQERYRGLGIESPYVAWGCHPDLFEVTPQCNPERVAFHYNAGVVSKRKPYREVVEAFALVRDTSLRLVFKAQLERQTEYLNRAAGRDPRIELVLEDLPNAEHLQLFADSDVCLAPSRWEGLGVHLYEAIAFGMPIITNDAPPMNELVEDGFNGLLVRSHWDGLAKSGISAYVPDMEELAEAIARLADPELREKLSEGARKVARRKDWSHTVSGIGELLAKLGAPVARRGSR